MELTYRVFDAFNRRDLHTFLALMDDAVESVGRAVAMEGGYHGHDGIRRWWENLLDVFPDFTAQVVEVRELGDLAVAATHIQGHGAGSGTPLDEKVWQVARWRHGKCVWWGTFDKRADALKAAGLSEQDAGDRIPALHRAGDTGQAVSRSTNNVELIHRFFAAFTAGDFDSFMDLFTDDAVGETDPSFPEGGTLVGYEQIRRFHEGLHEGWHGGSGVSVGDIRTAGDRVFASFDWAATGETSGIETSSQWYLVVWVREGKISRLRYFRERAEALDATGLQG